MDISFQAACYAQTEFKMKQNRKALLKSIFYGIALVFMMSGCCMDSLNRNHACYLKSDNNIYTTTQLNWNTLSDIYASPHGSNDFRKLAAAYALICGPVVLLDMPVSLTIDTICFPYDIYDYFDKYYIPGMEEKTTRYGG